MYFEIDKTVSSLHKTCLYSDIAMADVYRLVIKHQVDHAIWEKSYDNMFYFGQVHRKNYHHTPQ